MLKSNAILLTSTIRSRHSQDAATLPMYLKISLLMITLHLQTTTEYLTFAATSKLIAAAATYPYQVIRTRMQDQNHNYSGTWVGK
jgi:Mitochondrial carrier protein